jgi:RimJ/RimL family protein N-acetyltransferase
MLKLKHLFLRLVEESDVDFILSLRLNNNLNKYINKTSEDRNQQIKWIKSYKETEKIGLDFYFVIEDVNLGSLGLIRIYEIDYLNKLFTLGSFIIREENRPKYAAMEGILLAYDFAFNELNLNLCKCCVDNDNKRVIDFQNRFGAKFLYQDEKNNFFEVSKSLYTRLKYSKYYSFFMN